MRPHRRLRAAALPVLCSLALAGAVAPAAATPVGDHRPTPFGRAALPTSDGWGSATTGTTGGSAADAAHTTVVRTRAELVAALGGDNAANGSNATPKLVYVAGTIDLNTDDSGHALGCDDYAAGTGYTLDAYLAAYDPAVWGRTAEPTGELETARVAAQKAQARQIQIAVGSNTTLVGLGRNARLLGGNLLVKKADNVIVRNLTLEDAADCFPQWDPTDTAVGNWNSEYDSITLYTATHVWVDHSTFTDGANQDADQPLYFDRPYQVHDGQLDITNASDYVTASWNVFKDHDKTNLVGSSNSSTTDPGHLRVTFHHNLWQNTGQRAPRVRFGQVDVYNNVYAVGTGAYEYSIGVGKGSQIVAEHNYVRLPSGVPASKVLYNWGGTGLTAADNLVNGRPGDLIGAFNTANPATPLGTSAGWTPTLRREVTPTVALPWVVGARAGAGRL
ncbi:polysaccharide lyase family 1 protein [Kitasatospora sp. NE20-6]|uniref:pectate lyase family protein n=1 Tax=Kitasatospora sp. NE20-6 TaxID=2859066 RepID=UPI0038B24600